MNKWKSTKNFSKDEGEFAKAINCSEDGKVFSFLLSFWKFYFFKIILRYHFLSLHVIIKIVSDQKKISNMVMSSFTHAVKIVSHEWTQGANG
jgi:hypothetical protein